MGDMADVAYDDMINEIVSEDMKRDKSLQDKAIDFKGKKYVLVSDRVIFFNENYPQGSITTELVSALESENIIVKATVRPDASRSFTGYSQATKGDGYINKTSALENAETSAVGRALAFMGIGVIESIASVDEINKSEASMAFQTKSKVPMGAMGGGPGAGQAVEVNLPKSSPTEPFETKVCTSCGKSHTGKYGKCLACWKLDNPK